MDSSLLQSLYAWKKNTFWSALHMSVAVHEARPLNAKYMETSTLLSYYFSNSFLPISSLHIYLPFLIFQ